MKVVILGAKGMLGRDLGKVFYDCSPYLLDKDELDITDEKGTSALLRHLSPDVVINAAAYTDVDGCETNREIAMRANGDAPGYLAKAAKDVGAVFVHYSTDYVFDGNKQGGYSEDDEPGNPLNFYGESKLAGEKAVRAQGGNYYIVRTSWLYGINGKNFVETILSKANLTGSDPVRLKVVNDQHGKPTFSLDLARKTREILEDKKEFGIYHITNEPHTTWYDFAKAIIKKSMGSDPAVAGSDPEKLVSVAPCASAEFPRPAKRPHYSILLNTKLPLLRSWQDALKEYLLARK